jgi:hypothetical protein
MLALHEALYTTLLILSSGLTLWAFFFLITGQPVSGAFHSTYVLAVGTSVAQAVVGLTLYLTDHRPGENFHYLYGVSLMVFTGAGYAFATRGDNRREPIIFAVASLAAVGIITRAYVTGHH